MFLNITSQVVKINTPVQFTGLVQRFLHGGPVPGYARNHSEKLNDLNSAKCHIRLHNESLHDEAFEIREMHNRSVSNDFVSFA